MKTLSQLQKIDAKIHAFLSWNKKLSDADFEQEKLIALKDNLCVKGMKTTSGSKILENYIAPYSATVIKKLKKFGFAILGKTNMDEFAMGSSTENSAFFTTKNPWDLSRVPGGSSGGSAAAVSAGIVNYALGSDTGGSIRQPASFCGAVGLKPTYGRVSRYGLIAMASSLDQIGPITRTVQQSAEILQIIAGFDKKDTTTLKRPVLNYVDELKKNLKGLKFGVPKEYFQGDGLDDDLKNKVKEGIEAMKNLGAEIQEISLPNTDYALACYYIIVPAEVSSNLARFDGMRYGMRSKKAKNLIETYFKTRGEFLGAEVKRRIILGTFVLSHGYNEAFYKKAQKARLLVKKDFQEAFKKVDCILTPTTPTPAFKIGEKVDNPLAMYLADVFTVPVNIAGLPAISVPCGFVERDNKKLPVGLQIIGPWFREDLILRAGYWYEASTGLHEQRSEAGKD